MTEAIAYALVMGAFVIVILAVTVLEEALHLNGRDR